MREAGSHRARIPVASQVTALEIWLLACILLVFGALAEYAFILRQVIRLSRQQRKEEEEMYSLHEGSPSSEAQRAGRLDEAATPINLCSRPSSRISDKVGIAFHLNGRMDHQSVPEDLHSHSHPQVCGLVLSDQDQGLLSAQSQQAHHQSSQAHRHTHPSFSPHPSPHSRGFTPSERFPLRTFSMQGGGLGSMMDSHASGGPIEACLLGQMCSNISPLFGDINQTSFSSDGKLCGLKQSQVVGNTPDAILGGPRRIRPHTHTFPNGGGCMTCFDACCSPSDEPLPSSIATAAVGVSQPTVVLARKLASPRKKSPEQLMKRYQEHVDGNALIIFPSGLMITLEAAFAASVHQEHMRTVTPPIRQRVLPAAGTAVRGPDRTSGARYCRGRHQGRAAPVPPAVFLGHRVGHSDLNILTWNAAHLGRGTKALALSHVLAANDDDVAVITETELPPGRFSPKFSLGAHHRVVANKRSHHNPAKPDALTHPGPPPQTQWITDCMTVSSQPGHYTFQSVGEAVTCGVYLVAEPDQVVEIEFKGVDIPCDGSLLVFLDGWELNGSVFPDMNDHGLPMEKRFAEMCNENMAPRPRYISSQNAALVQYLVPAKGKGFSMKVRFVKNPTPCNVLMSDMEGLFTLKNFGAAKNCSLTSLLFPANFEVMRMKVRGSKKSCQDCSNRLEIGGSSSLESVELQAKETFCECDAHKIQGKGSTVLCGSSTVRMVSTGGNDNIVSVWARPAGHEDDLDFGKNHILMCPDFMD
eukprot:maker-scaffold109_size355148-snap-gene-0.14 protein:Tk11020 transcript:maker-scaffold109_size355148-snap-gene-0.14-mRNA-1 annotation:"corticotropin-releasing hormone binding protein"